MKYVYVENNTVVTAPASLPKNWQNISNLPALSDPELLELGWFPAIIITPEYDPYYQYLSGYDYLINATDVEATMVVVDKSPIPSPPLPPIDGATKVDAANVAKQGEDIFLHDISRRDVGAPPIIPDADKAIWDDWMRTNYIAMDNGQAPVEPPAEVRRVIDMPEQVEGQCVIRWHEFTGAWAGWGFQAEFERKDVASLGLKVYDENEAYLYALTFEATADPSRWFTETPAGFANPTKINRTFEIIAGSSPVSEKILLDDTVEYRSFIVKWQPDAVKKVKSKK